MDKRLQTGLIDRIYEVNDKVVYGFFKDHRFLSNFHVCDIEWNGLNYTSTEAAYQASKSSDIDVKIRFTKMSPSEAKKEGRRIEMVENFDLIKLGVMKLLVHKKFSTHGDLKAKLLSTGNRYLEETNYWNDRFWGADMNHVGKNHLGKILMDIRKILSQSGEANS